MRDPLLLLAGVAAVGVLHTAVPDHWAPIVAIARQRGWSRAETVRAALVAGGGHVGSTLVLGIVVWLAGAAAAQRFGHAVDVASSLALVGFGLWVAVSAWREIRHAETHAHHPHHHEHPHGHDHHHEHDGALGFDPLYLPLPAGTAGLIRHVHIHRHGTGLPHRHWHDHGAATVHAVAARFEREPPMHDHRHRTSVRTALLLILGSSPMVEGIPLFFAAARWGAGLILLMAVLFAAATIATYALLCSVSLAGAARLRLGRVERWGEVLSGGFIAAVGLVFGLLPAL
jgi:ABC-type nickel/cobalt efflux system permease component RcnA